MAVSMFVRCRQALLQLEQQLFRIIGVNGSPGSPPFSPALSLGGTSFPDNSSPNNPSTEAGWREAISGSIFWAVPKSRRSAEKRRLRKNGHTKLQHWATPRRNITECLQCGHWHIVHTICGNCYERVREETEAMRAAMPTETRQYAAPRTEVVYRYEGEQVADPGTKVVIDIERPRPGWFSDSLVTKPRRGSY